MSKFDLTQLVNVQVDGVNTGDYPDFCDAYIVYAYHDGLDRELTEEELDYLNESVPELAQRLAYESIF